MAEENNALTVTAPMSLAELQSNNLAKYGDDQFEKMSKSADYLCRLQLNGVKSNLFIKGKVERYEFLYVVKTDEDYVKLGKSIDIHIIGWRPKALDMNTDPPKSFFDINSTGFKDVMRRAEQNNSRCAWGPEFLVWVPTIKKFASLHMNSGTARKDSKVLRELIGKSATLIGEIRGPNRDNQYWDAIKPSACSTPFDMPTEEAMREELSKFLSTEDSKVEAPAVQSTRER